MTNYAHTLGDEMLVDKASDDDMSYEISAVAIKIGGLNILTAST